MASLFNSLRVHTSSHRERIWLVLIAAAGFIVLVLAPRLRHNLGIFDNDVWFLDSYAILAANDALGQGIDPAQPNPLDVYRRPHSYSHWWFVLRRIGFTRDDNFLFGGTMVLLFYAVALLNLAPRSRAELIWHAALMISPPVLLAVNRANNDLFVFALLGAGLWIARRPVGLRPIWFSGAVALATGLKFFPIVAAIAPVVLHPVRRGLAWAAVGSAVGLLVFASVREDLARAVFPVPEGTHVFGASVFWRNLGWTGHGPVIASLAVVGLVAGWLAWRGRIAGLAADVSDTAGERLAFMAGALLILACFAAGISYAYRWVFALWLAPWLWRQAWSGAPAVGSRATARFTCGLMTVVLWMDGLYCLAVNTLIGPMAPSRLQRLDGYWNLCMQPAVWLLLSLLAGWVAEALLATTRELLGRGGQRGAAAIAASQSR